MTFQTSTTENVVYRKLTLGFFFSYFLAFIPSQLCGAVIGAGILKGLTPEGLNSPLGATKLANGARMVGNESIEYAINPGQVCLSRSFHMCVYLAPLTCATIKLLPYVSLACH